jgi:FlaA1/EpsC-like NDP-sugar epimerase
MPILIQVLNELCGETKQDISGIRPGEKLHETLINHDEIHYAWEIDNMYMLANPHYKLFNDKNILENYDGIKKVEDINSYSSDTVEKITREELKEKIKNSGLLD